ncbi:MAG: hypothetical protein PWQ55_1152 [Chloroflexota bacterium]|nr:hypothetical protein [Chloroflexota bacterium]
MENHKQKRILWLLNHKTLMDFEADMLVRMGFEVYVPKRYPFDEANQSASVTDQYDSSLTIDSKLLERLNDVDFYSGSWPRWLRRELNRNFGIAIVPVFPKMMESAIQAFEGLIFLRIFGLEGNKTYARRFEDLLPPHLVDRIRKADNIRIAAGYDNVIDHEPPWLRRKCIHLPLGMKKPSPDEPSWTGEEKRILFVCPRINSNPYYHKIYTDFKQTFGDMPHIIPGAQPVPVTDDPSVTGFLNNEDYQSLFRSSGVMFYHSREERHLHYHPLEAVRAGMPLVFMAGGMLEYLAKKELPGCCSTAQQAREKLTRILDGDKQLIQDILSSQGVLLQEFEPDHVETCWRERFLPTVEQYFQKAPEPEKGEPEPALTHLGIWLHADNPRDLTGEGISHLIAMIIRNAQKQEDGRLRIHIALVTWMKQPFLEFLREEGIDTDQVVLETAGRRAPFLYLFYFWWINRKPQSNQRFLRWQGKVERFLRNLVHLSSEKFFSVRTFPGLILALLLSIALLPVLILAGFIYVILKASRPGLAWLVRNSRFGTIFNKIREKSVRVKQKAASLAPRVYHRMLQAEQRQLAEKIGQDKRFKTWFFAHPNNKFISHFTTPKVVAVPDIVYLDFPSLYSRYVPNLLEILDRNITETVRTADRVITFSDYVRDNHVVKSKLKAAGDVYVIPHAPVDKRESLSVREDVSPYDLRFMARHIIRDYLNQAAQASTGRLHDYLRDLDLGAIDYLFVSSQTRLHKNHMNLIKAYRILLRERYVNQKLVFTGKFSGEIEDYIKQERLDLDVLSFNKLPSKTHAAFYTCASLTVTPTLFEGGFPFTFSESLSVGTPIVLSDIPVVREALSEAERQSYCFDPYDLQAMAAKIAWALEHREQLLKDELKTLDRMKVRNWEDVAADYLRVFLGKDTSTESQAEDAAGSNQP